MPPTPEGIEPATFTPGHYSCFLNKVCTISVGDEGHLVDVTNLGFSKVIRY